MQLTAGEIARIVDGQLAGEPGIVITGVAGLKEARPGDLSFLAHPKYLPAAQTTRASLLLVAPDSAGELTVPVVRVENPSLAFSRIVSRLAPPPREFTRGIHPTAVVASTARLGREVSVQPLAVIEGRAEIGDRAVIGAHCVVGPDCRVGPDCLLYPGVILRERTVLGQRVILHGGVVLGADGFGYELVDGRHQKIPQVGSVEIGDDVEIGANSCVDRGRFGVTRIGAGSKIDNLVQIGHNCVIGEHCIICGGVGIAGSVVIGTYVTIAGQVGIANHLTIGDRAILGAQSGIAKDVPADTMVWGTPAEPHLESKRMYTAAKRLPAALAKLRELEKEIAALRARLGGEQAAGDCPGAGSFSP